MPRTAWLAPIILATVAFMAGMARAFGAPGISLGLCVGVMFLVGLLSARNMEAAERFAGWYALGSLWVIAFELPLWRLRPYGALYREIAECFGACARLVGSLTAAEAERYPRSFHRRLRLRHQALRKTIDTAEATLESLRLGSGHRSRAFDNCQSLLAAVSREGAAAVSLRSVSHARESFAEARAWAEFLIVWRETLEGTARWLLKRRGTIANVRLRVVANKLFAKSANDEIAKPVELALMHLDQVAEMSRSRSRSGFRWSETIPTARFSGLRALAETVRSQLSFRPIIFRHALRVAIATGFGLWVTGLFVRVSICRRSNV
jgi:uncharacterized membrane protein YccC